MCKYCDTNSKNRRVFFDNYEREFYVRSYYWNENIKDWMHDRLYLYGGFCPFCGKSLRKFCGVKNKQLIELLIQEWINNGIIKNQKENSCEHHCISTNETEILGSFCDHTSIYGEDLKKILIMGFLCKEYEKNMKNK